MYLSYNPTKDTTLVNAKINGYTISSSNSGQSEVAELFHITSSIFSLASSRIIMYFDLTSLSQSIANGDVPSSSVEYHLYMKDAPHQDEVPSSYDISVYPLSRSFDEGRGLSNYDMGLKDRNQYANWANATSIQLWSLPGGDYLSSPTGSQHFDFGTEDLDINISNIVYAWLTGGTANNGLMIKFQDVYESGTVDYAFKRFYTRHAHVPERRPSLSARFAKTLQDDRSNVYFGVSSSLYYYRFLNGNFDNLSPLYCNIINASGAILQTLTASRPNATNGIHQISGVFVPFNTGSFVCNDVWFSGTTQYFTGTFNVSYFTGASAFNFEQMNVNITNIKSFYNQGEKVDLRVLMTPIDYRPAVLSYAAIGSTPVFMKQAYYEISNQKTGQVLIPFSTGSLEFSKLSYDQNGNYFELWTDSLPKDNIYKIRILAQFNNEKFIFDKNWIINLR